MPRDRGGDSSDAESNCSRTQGSVAGSSGKKMLRLAKYDDNKRGLDVLRSMGGGSNGGGFRKVKSIDEVYKVGKDVVPVEPRLDRDGNPIPPSRAAKFGIRKSDMKRCVLKIRSKKKGFINTKEIDDWIRMMNVLYNLSGGKDAGSVHKFQRISLIYDLLEDDQYYYVSMEYVRGRDLFDFHAEEAPATNKSRDLVAKYICRDMLLACQELHGFGLVHRDLKLENAVLDESEGGEREPGTSLYEWVKKCKVKIIDFDTVEVWKPETIIPHVMGTDQYIAPEVYCGIVTPACDVWAIGAMVFVLWTGHFPFPANLFTDGPGENTVGHPQMEIVRNNLRCHKIDFNSMAWSQNRDAKDLIKRCFLSDHRSRITVASALEHPFILKDK